VQANLKGSPKRLTALNQAITNGTIKADIFALQDVPGKIAWQPAAVRRLYDAWYESDQPITEAQSQVHTLQKKVRPEH